MPCGKKGCSKKVKEDEKEVKHWEKKEKEDKKKKHHKK